MNIQTLGVALNCVGHSKIISIDSKKSKRFEFLIPFGSRMKFFYCTYCNAFYGNQKMFENISNWTLGPIIESINPIYSIQVISLLIAFIIASFSNGGIGRQSNSSIRSRRHST